ncbi:MAG: hypothetical protein WCV58_00060 [Patescibacteria group bacterium]
MKTNLPSNEHGSGLMVISGLMMIISPFCLMLSLSIFSYNAIKKNFSPSNITFGFIGNFLIILSYIYLLSS